MLLSQLPHLEYAGYFFGTTFIGFGLLYFIDIPTSISFFELQYPKLDAKASAREKEAFQHFENFINVFAIVYGIRDVFMGVALVTAALIGSREIQGYLSFAAGLVAFVDGVATQKVMGKGAMNHWGYAPILTACGAAILGWLDW